ncbi:MAG: hypothetical protein JWO08_3077 [Verrucomicrobiaceae bacterium]|nr:hypothetical protein [Verrucomicrobiaceae bacterium]
MRIDKDLRLYVYGVVAALLCAIIITAIMMWPVATPPPATPVKAPAVTRIAPKPTTPIFVQPPAAPPSPIRDPMAIDPMIQGLADELASKEQPPTRDLEIVNEFVTLYSRAFQGNPIGMNEDITAVLTGHNPRKGILFPPNNPMIVNGQLVDHWGTPYWFHPSSSTRMEIRSAGPDKNLFTADDVVINPSPESPSGGRVGMVQ